MSADSQQSVSLKYLQGGGEMGQLIRDYNWGNTVLGSPETWSQSLLTTISIILNSRFPMFLWWGEDLIQFYNDAYRPSLGNSGKHPGALGQKGVECWPEIWHVINPLIDQVLSGGDGTWSEDQLIPIYRNGRLEDVHWTFSYSRVNDESGNPGGVLVICSETTKQIKAYKELQTAKNELEFAIKAAELATWDLNPATGNFVGNDRLKEWLDMPSEGEVPLSAATALIAEYDRQRVLDALSTALTWESGGNFAEIYTIISEKNVEPRIVKARGKALFNEQNIAVRFSGTIQDITDEVNATKQLQRALEQARLSKQAAQLGTFDMDLEKGTMEWDERCRILFGISHSNDVSYEKDFVPGLHPEDRDRITKLIDNLFIREISNGDYDVEYRTVGVEDQKIRWVRAKGKVYFNGNTPVRFIGSVLDITEQKSDEMRKNDFIGMVSHELKTPLTSLKAYLQVLQERAEKSADEFTSKALTKADNQVKKMTSLINSFLNISRFESGKIHLNMTGFRLDELVAEMIEEVKITISKHQIIFQNYRPVNVFADKDKIASVISNLLSNAGKYSAKNTTIFVVCNVVNGMAQVCVKDEGIGINQQEIDKLFDRYYRVESNNTQHISGFGIGLYLSSEIITRHSGKIWAESEDKKGSKFTFTLPLKK